MSHDPLRLLLVEDNAGDAVLLEHALRGVKHLQFKLARVDRIGMLADRLRADPFDVLILDLDLPDSRGLNTVRRAVATATEIPIVVLTGRDDENTGLEAVRIGAQDYVTKGDLDKWSLVRSIRHAIERKQTQQALLRAHNELELKVQERTIELQRLNQALQVLSACNEALARATDEASLLREICQVILNVGDYRMAWVGFASDDPEMTVIPAAYVGFEEGYLASTKITWADEEHGRGPTGMAIRTGQVQVVRDFATDPAMASWRQQALERGFNSSIALPLTSAGRTLGALNIYASQADAFDDKSIQVLKQLADDLAFGLTSLRTQGALRRVEREVLEATEREQQRIGRDLHDSLQGSLAGIVFMLEAMKKGLAKSEVDPAKLTTEVEGLAEVVRNTLSQTRGLVRGLCPLELKSDGLMRALKLLAATTSDLFRASCHFRCPAPVNVDDETTATQLYRICQEAVNNALKHAKPKSINISLERTGEVLTLEVLDDGVGLPQGAEPTTGMGLRTMKYRAKLIGADLAIGRGENGGTRVRCVVPDSPG